MNPAKPRRVKAATTILREADGDMQDTLDTVEPIQEAPVRDGLQVVSIAKSYDKRTVLTDVSVSVGRGEVIGLLGPNGAGKTTTMRLLLGLIEPDAGHVRVALQRQRHRIGGNQADGGDLRRKAGHDRPHADGAVPGSRASLRASALASLPGGQHGAGARESR